MECNALDLHIGLLGARLLRQLRSRRVRETAAGVNDSSCAGVAKDVHAGAQAIQHPVHGSDQAERLVQRNADGGHDRGEQHQARTGDGGRPHGAERRKECHEQIFRHAEHDPMEPAEEASGSDQVDRRPVHVDGRAQAEDEVGDVVRDPVLLHSAGDAHGESRGRRRRPQARGKSGHDVEEVSDGVSPSQQENHGREEDKRVEEQTGQRCSKQETEAAAHHLDVQPRRAPEDQ
mmetsp:Transcript_107298/g.346226  ORF Transcript_107298/g.346226 Transcript_107298/m.346226 type:complete len:233 (+) Transcript_107298:88-786(+)